MTVSKDAETFTHHQRDTRIWTLDIFQGRHTWLRGHSGTMHAQAEGPEMKLKSPTSRTLRNVGMRKGSNGVWSSVKGPLRNVASVRKLLRAARRGGHNSFNTQRELIQPNIEVSNFFGIPIRAHGWT